MTMARVFAHADVSDEQKITDIFTNRPQRSLNNSVLVVAIGPDFVLVFRQSEQNDSANASGLRLFRDFDRIVDRQIELSRHRTDFFPNLFTWTYKDRIDH